MLMRRIKRIPENGTTGHILGRCLSAYDRSHYDQGSPRHIPEFQLSKRLSVIKRHTRYAMSQRRHRSLF